MDKASEAEVTRVKVSPEVAETEVDRFLDIKRISPDKRTGTFEQQIKELTAMVVEGRLTFDFEKKRATYNLIHPLTTKMDKVITELSLQIFLGVQQGNMYLKNVDIGNVDAKTHAIVAGMAGHPVAVLTNAKNSTGENGMDMSDSNSLRSYIMFFLV